MKLSIGFGKVDVTPPEGGGTEDLRVLGFWYERAKRYERIHDPLHARAAVFAAGDDVACIVSVDMIGDAVGFGVHARACIHKTLGIAPERVMVACTHCHTSPETIGVSGHPVAQTWLDRLADGIVEAVKQAAKSLSPRALCMAERHLEGVSVNRRERYRGDAKNSTASKKDDVLRLAWAQAAQGDIPGALVNFACHPVAVQTQPFISADYPGLAMSMLEERVGVSLFTNGAAGDINPARKDGLEDVTWAAEAIASAANEVLESAPQTEWAEAAGIQGVTKRIRLPRRAMPRVGELEREKARLEAEVAAAGDLNPRTYPDHPGAKLHRVNEQLAVAAMPDEIEAELQAIEIGDWLAIGIPGELVCSLGDDIRQAAERHNAWVIGYANGYIGYMLTRDDFDLGGYEVCPGRWSVLAPGGGEMIRDAAVELIRQIESL